jgi:GST-like protein
MIDLYSVFTANGQKVHVMLEETGLPYTAHAVDLYGGQHRTAEFRKLNPFARVPVLVDRAAPGGSPLAVAETTAILVYLAEKSGRLMPSSLGVRAEVHQWLSFVAANVGPLFRGLFKFGPQMPDANAAAVKYFVAEAEAAFAVVDGHLGTRAWLAGADYSIADIAFYPVASTSARQLPRGLEPFGNIRRWADAVARRPAVARGMAVLAPA